MLAGILGGLAGLAAGAVGRVAPAAAAAGDPLLIGRTNGAGAASTMLKAGSDWPLPAFEVRQNGSGTALNVLHQATSGGHKFGLLAEVRHASGTAVVGRSMSLGTAAHHSSVGVFGVSVLGKGVVGQATAETGTTYGVLGSVLSPDGWAGFFDGPLYTSSRFDLQEIPDPAAPVVNRARLFARDNGAGKTELCVRFATGAVVVLAVEP